MWQQEDMHSSNTINNRKQGNAHTQRSLIINGHAAEKGRFPYFVTLDRYCAGALIAPDIVLTAGHCKPELLSQQVQVGTYYYKNENSEESNGNMVQTFGLVHMKRHPDWIRRGDDEFVNDFTLLQLDGVASSDPFRPVRINRMPHIPVPHHDVVTVMGLGVVSTTDYEARPDLLQQVELSVWSNEECSMADDGQGQSFHTPTDRIGPSHLCTFVEPDNSKDACSYDSGGPIVLTPSQNDDDTDDLLVGLVSWGIGCADPVFPGVNARVSAVSDWIDAYVCEHSVQPPTDFACTTTTATTASGWNVILRGTGVVFVSLLLLALLYQTCCCCFCRRRRRGSCCRSWNRRDKFWYQSVSTEKDAFSTSDEHFTKGIQRHDTNETTNMYGTDDDDNEDDENNSSNPNNFSLGGVDNGVHKAGSRPSSYQGMIVFV